MIAGKVSCAGTSPHATRKRQATTGRPVNRIHRIAGFTLIELMVVLLIVGILGTVAVPAYRQYVIRAHRTEAKTALLRLAANQERHHLQHNTYTDDLAALGFAAGVSDNGVYTLSVPIADATSFQAAAVPTPGGGLNDVDMSRDEACARFTIDAAGRRSAFPDPGDACW